MPSTATDRPAALSSGGIRPSLKFLMAAGCGVVVANIYYCQPLLGAFAREFHVSQSRASLINILTQAGYGLGLFFVVPLGDKLERRRMIVAMHLLAAAALAAAALSGSINSLAAASLLIGIATTACQVFIPLAAHLARDEERGKVIGAVMGGLLAGILASRTLSGLVAQYYGWRTVYFTASLLMLVMAYLMARMLPAESPAFTGTYRQLMGSLWVLLKQQPVVQQSALIGAALFGAISAFWATMAFFLEGAPYHYPVSVIGLFGLIGAGGALASPLIGRFIDRGNPLTAIRFGTALILIGYLDLWLGRFSVLWVIPGVILLDLGMQSAHIPNMTRNYALIPSARTRLNTLYMTSFFIGGTLGSTVGSMAWDNYGWVGVCLAGGIMALIGMGAALFRYSKT